MRMTNALPDAGWYIGEQIKDCVIQYLEPLDHYSTESPYRATVETGIIAWDDCRCGQLAVSLISAYPSSNFPGERGLGDDLGTNRSDGACGPNFFVFQYNVTVLNCAPMGGRDARPPSIENVNNAAMISTMDAWAARAGVLCCMKDLTSFDNPSGQIALKYLIGTQTFVGPEGGCQGSELPVYVGIMNDCYPCIGDS